MIVETGFCALLFLAWKKGKKRGGKLSVEEETMFREAFENIRGKNASAMFRKLASGFEKYGHSIHAGLLLRRADYLDRTPEKKAEHEAIITRAMKSRNADAIDAVANAFEKMTATGIARDLRKHAQDVRDGNFPVVTPPPVKTEKLDSLVTKEASN
jgi:hypothetical protein